MAKGNKAIHEFTGKTDQDYPGRNLFIWTTGGFWGGAQHRTEHLWFETPHRRDCLNITDTPAA